MTLKEGKKHTVKEGHRVSRLQCDSLNWSTNDYVKKVLCDYSGKSDAIFGETLIETQAIKWLLSMYRNESNCFTGE